nr:peptide ABC transporter ATP-binding protein [Brachymonas sp.]
LCDQLCVLYRGEVVEYGPTTQVLQQPQHPYTQQLLAAAS